ncbi:hypothetical protein ACFSC4_25240 [Deinococcus malanensis]|uniref:hypothetical protein n=1 Tax=Deinococcus malanensis TaxID=1706855 RepID=UPI00363A542C
MPLVEVLPCGETALPPLLSVVGEVEISGFRSQKSISYWIDMARLTLKASDYRTTQAISYAKALFGASN